MKMSWIPGFRHGCGPLPALRDFRTLRSWHTTILLQYS